jgi:hypothetical protein
MHCIAGAEPEVPPWLVPMAVFCPVYSFLLLTTDDEDFYQRAIPLPLDQLPALVHLLKVRRAVICWVRFGRDSTGRSLTRPFWHARPILPTRIAARTEGYYTSRKVGRRPSFKAHFLSPRAKPDSPHSQQRRRAMVTAHGGGRSFKNFIKNLTSLMRAQSALSVCLGDGPRSLGKARDAANSSGGSAPLWRSTRHWLSRLLTQLHDRNCRRRFVKPEAFHSLDAVGTASMLVSEVLAPLPSHPPRRFVRPASSALWPFRRRPGAHVCR